MIDFRYHLVSVVAVFLALTVGLVLGTTVLQDPLFNNLESETAELRGQSEDLRAERDEAERLSAGADELAEAAAPELLEGRLDGLDVVTVAAHGTADEAADALDERIHEAGGTPVGRVELTGALLDPQNGVFVDELAIQVARDPDRLSGGPYDKVGTELGRALAPEGADGDAATESETADPGGENDAHAVLAAFAEGGLLELQGEPARSADAVVVIVPAVDAPVPNGDREGADTLLATVTAALHDEIGPTVLAGDVASAEGSGLVARVRADGADYATVDVVGRPTGDIATVLALADALDGSGGAYGVGENTEGFLPSPLPEPREDPVPAGADDEPGDQPDDEPDDGDEQNGAGTVEPAGGE